MNWVQIACAAFCFLLSIATAHCKNQDSLQVLFIGNSYTYLYNMPAMLDSMAMVNNKAVRIDMAAKPGYSLKQHTEDSLTLFKINERKWDMVIFQERGSLVSNSVDENEKHSYTYARELDSIVHDNSPASKIVFFLSWVPEKGNPTIEGDNFKEALKRISVGYKTIADELNAGIAPVGQAWDMAINEFGITDDLWYQDRNHSSAAGAYLNALVFYQTIFSDTPKKSWCSGYLQKEKCDQLIKVARSLGD